MLPGPSSPRDRADPSRGALPSASLASERDPSPSRPGPPRIPHSLPSIRELHPGLRLPSPIPLSPTAASGSGHGHLQLHGYPVASGSTLGECISRPRSCPDPYSGSCCRPSSICRRLRRRRRRTGTTQEEASSPGPQLHRCGTRSHLELLREIDLTAHAFFARTPKSFFLHSPSLLRTPRTSMRITQNASGVRSSVIGRWLSHLRGVSCLIVDKLGTCRAQPCGPCTRRGEPSKCQWHIIEPMYAFLDLSGSCSDDTSEGRSM